MSKLSLQAVLEVVDKATKPIRDIQGSSKKLSESMAKQRDVLKSLNRVQGNITHYKRLQSALKDTSKDLSVAEKKAQALSEQYENIPKKTKAMTRELEKAQASVKKLTHLKQEQVAQLKNTVRQLNEAGVKTNRLSDHERELATQVHAATQALRAQGREMQQIQAQQAAMAQAQASYSGANNLEAQIGAIAAQAAISASVGAAGLSVPIKAFTEAEDAWTQLQIAMMRADGSVAPEFKKISDLATNMGNDLPGTTAEFQAMMTMLVKQGISFQDILNGVGEAAGKLGVVLKMPFEDAAEFAAKMQDATRTAAPDMIKLMDTIQRMSYLGVDSNNMLEGFKNLGPAMDMVNMKGLEGAKALAPFLVMLDQAGMDGGAAGNALRKIFSGGYDQAKINDALADLKKTKGINMKLDFTNGKGEFGGLDNMFKQLDKLKILNAQDRTMLLKEIFGTDAEVATSLATTIGKGKAGYDEVVAKMQAQADLQQRVNAQLSTLKNLWDAATGTFTNTMVTLGQTVEPQLKALTKWLTDLSGRLDKWIKTNPELVNTLMQVAMGMVALLAVISLLAFALATILVPLKLLRFAYLFLRYSLITSTVAAWRYSVSILGAAANTARAVAVMIGSRIMAILPLLRVQLLSMATAAWAAAAPFWPFILAAIALAGVAYLIYKNWAPVKQFLLGLGSSIAASAVGAWNSLTTTFDNIWGRLSSGVKGLWQTIKSEFSGGIGNVSTAIVNWSPLGVFYKAFAAVLSWFGIELPARFTGFGSMIMQGLANGIRNGVGSVVAVANEAAANIVAKTKAAFGIHSPSRIFAQMGAYNMQGLANGITANAGLPAVAVGSASQSVLNAFDNSQIRFDRRPPITAGKSNTAANAAASSAFSPTINVYPAAGMDEQQLARMVAAEVAKLQNIQAAATRRSYSDLE